MLRSFGLAAAALALIISEPRCSRETVQPEVTTVPTEAALVAQQYLECAKRANELCAVELFHYPKDETEDERRADVEAVRQSFSVITKHFGMIGPVQRATGRLVYVEVAAGSADITYWQKHPESLKVTYETTFSKYGEGFVAVELCNISGRWEIRSVHYGLPATDPRSTGRIMRVFNELQGAGTEAAASKG